MANDGKTKAAKATAEAPFSTATQASLVAQVAVFTPPPAGTVIIYEQVAFGGTDDERIVTSAAVFGGDPHNPQWVTSQGGRGHTHAQFMALLGEAQNVLAVTETAPLK